MKRRQLLKIGGVGVAATVATGAAAQPPEFHWKMVMSWPKKFPGLATAAEWFATELEKVTNGRIKVDVYGAGELVPAFEVFNAVSNGVAELGHGGAYYWKGRIPESEIFTSVPFGMTPVELTAWYYYGGGLALETELYKPFGVIPLLCGNTDIQMGGWFNKEIHRLADLEGLKIRMIGIAGEVFKRAGATPVAIPGTEIFTAMKNGTIDATDWVGPWNDQAFGLYKAAKYYYGGWQETSAAVDLLVNEKAWQSLPPDLQAQLKVTAEAANQRMLSEYRAHNASALQTLLNKEHVEIRYLPDEVIAELKKHTNAYLDEYAGQSEIAGRIAKSYRDFLKQQIKLAENEHNILRYRTM